MDRRVRATIELLDGQWERRVSVSELARRVGLGASRLEHLFKAHARITIRDFVREQRLVKAAEMLLRTEERISVIGERVGFRDAANFNHAFKKRFGVGPRVFRDRRQNNEDSTSDQETPEDTK
jgi:transcriptional regulator GlxA family with amidase domain